MKFYRCEHCGNIITFVHSAGVPVMCCGQKMTELVPGTTDGAVEKHVPVVEVQGSTVQVKVGSVEHPMLPEHHIQWIAVACDRRLQLAHLAPGEAPEAAFHVPAGVPVTVYEYCNLHGLWKAEA